MNRSGQLPRILAGLLAVIAGAFGLGARAADDAGREAELKAELHRVIPLLVSSGDADSLAAAAMLDWEANRSEQTHLMSQAVAAAPDRPDLVWLYWRLCLRDKSCDSTPIEGTLRALDPGNGVAWAGALSRSGNRADPAGIQAAVNAISNAKRFDIYWNTSIFHLVTAVERKSNLRRSALITAVMGSEAAIAIPEYAQLSKACKGSTAEDLADPAACRKLAAVLIDGDTFLTEAVGLRIAMQSSPEGSEAYRRASDAMRVARYSMQKIRGTKLADEQMNDEYAGKYMAWVGKHRREQDVAVDALLDAGIDPNPPPGWTWAPVPPR